MTSKTKSEAKKRTEMLVALRNRDPERLKQTQALLKEQQSIRRVLQHAMETGPQTIPQLAEATGMPSREVLWHVISMKKYGLVEEVAMNEDETYYLYGLSKEAKS
jgi:predicted ArsR family transcriptional regulator